jgi:tetratricopeptide (TPR) repeat protein
VSESNSYIDITVSDQAKAKAFFDRAAPLVAASQYDYAFTMYLNGLMLDPESLEAHQALRDASLRRKAGGGKSLGMFGSMKFPTKGKDERQNMNNAERILAHDPGDTSAMVALLEAAYRCGAYDTALWIGPILGRANNELSKPDYSKFEKLRDVYAKLGRYDLAVEVCMRMVQLRPEDGDLKNDLKNLTAEAAMVKGKYKQSYRESIRNSEKQDDLLQAERDNVSEEYTDKVAREAEQDMKANPEDLSKLGKYVDALRKTGRMADEEKAGQLLADAFQKTGAYKFRATLIDMRLKQLVAEFRQRQASIASAANDEEKRERIELLKQFERDRAQEEAALFEEHSGQYPTEAKWKYEVAKRYVKLERYTDAIPLFQYAVNDPKLRVPASIELGKTFLEAEFPDEAADTLGGLIESYSAISAGDELAKEIMYWHGRSLEAKGDIPAALKSFSQVVKWDFNYRDTQKRMKELRAQPK